MRQNFYCLLLALVCVTTACELDYDYPYTSEKELVTLNAVLTPDSTVTVEMYWASTIPNPEGDFQPVTSARLTLYENNELLGTLNHTGNGTYKLAYYPKAGRQYDLKAEVPDYPQVESTTVIPGTIDLQACYSPVPNRNQAISTLRWKDSTTPGEVYWIALQGRTYADENGGCSYEATERVKNFIVSGLHTNSLFVDEFNGALSEGVLEYNFMRIPDTHFNGEEYSAEVWSLYNCVYPGYEELQALDSPQALVAHIMQVSPEYDQYLKTTYTNFLNDKIADKNLFFDTAPIYSNIKNGTGIFGSYTSSQVAINKSPCQ